MPDFTGLDLTNKTAIVTGASRGIGAAIAAQLGRRGARVVVNHASAGSAAKARDVAAAVEASGGRAVVVQADITVTSELRRLVDAALELSVTGKIEILIHKYVALLPLFYSTSPYSLVKALIYTLSMFCPF